PGTRHLVCIKRPFAARTQGSPHGGPRPCDYISALLLPPVPCSPVRSPSISRTARTRGRKTSRKSRRSRPWRAGCVNARVTTGPSPRPACQAPSSTTEDRLMRLLLLACVCVLPWPARAPALEPIPDKLVVLTFDDASKSHFTVARPLLKKYG